jgi:serine/threonine-protein kinase HipA
MSTTPVWTWLPGQSEPVLAAHVEVDASGGYFKYEAAYHQMSGSRALDPISLRFGSGSRSIRLQGKKGLPGVVLDAMPEGYGRDQLQAKHQHELSPLDLLEVGPGDAVGAIAVCHNIQAKMDWRAHRLSDLTDQLALLDDDAPSSKAIRRMNDDGGTSAGGERPKVTIEADGELWMAKLQDRGDSPHLPAREFTVMNMAADVGIDIPKIRLLHQDGHEMFMIQRFDRTGDPKAPQRHLFASAHSVLRLVDNPLPGDPMRSYLVLADHMTRWVKDGTGLEEDLAQLWRRMSYNALVGNKDDHTRNHGLLHDGSGWRLSKAYDITPLPTFVRSLALSVSPDGSQACSPRSLLQVAGRFGVEVADAAAWLSDAANHVADTWQQSMRENGIPDVRLAQFAPAFVISDEIANDSSVINDIVEQMEQSHSKRRGHRHR